MFFGLAWYWWLVIMAVLASIPFKIKCMKWWRKRQQEKDGRRGKWGDDE